MLPVAPFSHQDSEMPYSRAISRLSLTALASATVSNLTLRSYVRRRVLSIFAIEQEVEGKL